MLKWRMKPTALVSTIQNLQASGRTGRAVPITGWPLLNTQGSVSDWDSPVFADVLFSKPHGREGRESCKLTNLPGKCLPAWRATCRGKSNLYFFQRNAVAAGPLITYICLSEEEKDAEEVDFNKSSLRTAHWDVLFWGGFYFSHERIWLNLTESPLNSRQEVTLRS